MDSSMTGSNVWDDTPLSNDERTYSNGSFDNNPHADPHSSSHYPSQSLWGDSTDPIKPTSTSPYNDDNVDEFKIQNELAHTMKSIVLDDRDDNDNDNYNDNNHDDYEKQNNNITSPIDHVHYVDSNKSDIGNPFLASSVPNEEDSHINNRVDINLLKEKKNQLLDSLTKESTSHSFLKGADDDVKSKIDNDTKNNDNADNNENADELFTSPSKPYKTDNGNNANDDSVLENLLTLTGPDMKNTNDSDPSKAFLSTSSDRSSKYKGIVSPNRKIKILRPRRVTKNILLNSAESSNTKKKAENPLFSTSTTIDPLSAPLSNNTENIANLMTSSSPTSRKQKFINESESLLFNINKDQILAGVVNAQPESSKLPPNALNLDGNFIDDDAEKFDITVGDPIKVSDLTSAHVVYTINTKSKCNILNVQETVVTRRYNDFLWLYHQLLNNHPGYIIPPPPEKQAYGRFDDKFIENRRLALENMLNKIAKRKILQRDPDYIIFLQSENFNEDSKSSEIIIDYNGDVIDSNENNGDTTTDSNVDGNGDREIKMNTMKQLLNSAVSLGLNETSSSSGFFSSLIGLNTPKYVEEDSFILEKQVYVDNLDQQLRQLSQSLDMILEKREELSLSLNDVSTVLLQICDLEVNVEITEILSNFEELQTKIRELLDNGNVSQVLTFGSTVDEYIRLIGSVRNCFDNRLKVCNSVSTLKQHAEKKEHNLIKFKSKSSSQVEKIRRLEEELASINLVLSKQVKFKENYDKIFKNELQKFEFDKIKDFKNMVEIYWESLIESQKVLIELWESFYDKCKFDA